MKVEKARNTVKTQVESRSAKTRPVKAGIKMRSGLRAGYGMGFTDKY
jgi:hypothetical protein